MIDKRLTILLMLKDRSDFTQRWMSYHNHVALPFPIFIADGSTDDRTRDMLSAREFANLDFQYMRYPADVSYREFHEKVTDALSRIDTPLVALADNDDFFIVEGVRDAIQFLERHDEYAACGGQCAVFWIHPAPARGDDLTYGPRIEWKSSRERQSITEETAWARIGNLPGRTTNAGYYHLRRTAQLRRHFEGVRDADLQDPFLAERAILFLSAVAGKSRQLQGLYIARQWNTPGSAGHTYAARNGDWFGRMLAASWSRDFTAFVDLVATALEAEDGLPPDIARRRVVEAYRDWVAPHVLADVAAEPTVTMGMLLGVRMFRRLISLADDHPLRWAARWLYRRSRWISVDAIHGTEWRGRGVPGGHDALNPIREFLSRPESPWNQDANQPIREPRLRSCP
jgi:glycosyltransferase domain-containing protein